MLFPFDMPIGSTLSLIPDLRLVTQNNIQQ